MTAPEQDNVKLCPRTGLSRKSPPSLTRWSRFVALASGALALLWYVLRVTPKPSRAAYPCQQAAAPLALGFLAYLGGTALLGVALRGAHSLLLRSRYVLAALSLTAGAGAASYGLYVSTSPADAAPTGTFTPTDQPNAPLGKARGIHPGRVAWAWDPAATSWNATGTWWDDTWNDQAAIEAMLTGAIQLTAGEAKLADAWAAIFKYHNAARGRAAQGYLAGEKVVVKVNLNNSYSAPQIDSSPHLALAVLRQLVEQVGVAQGDITVYDAQRGGDAISALWAHCQPVYPDVHYNDIGDWVNDRITYSAGSISADARRLPQGVVDATYLINLPVLKRHCAPSDNYDEGLGQTGVTLGGKSHCGTVGSCAALHQELRDWNEPGPSFNPLVDIWASPEVGGKTLLTVLDALYGGNQWSATPKPWKLAPFSNDWPSSLFVSQDFVALDSVGLDFLHAEMDLTARADNYLHEAALASAAPSGFKYAADSLGVHEHWNSPEKKQYSRNLGTGAGIELLRTDQVPPTTGAGGATSTGGALGSGGALANGGAQASGGASQPGGTGASGATLGNAGAGSNADPSESDAGCGCRTGVGHPARGATPLGLLGLLGGALLALRRNSRAR